MATEIKIPSLGEGVTSGDVLEVLVAPGDIVKKDQGLIELETDKATVTVPSPSPGKIVKVLVTAGQTVNVGGAIVEMEIEASAAPAPAAPKPAAPASPPAAPAPPAAASKPVVQAPPTPAPAPAASAPTASVAPAPTPIAQVQSNPVMAQVMTDIGNPDEVIPAGPAIRRFAREVGVDLNDVVGTGDSGRITREDVLAVVRHASQAARSNAPSAASAATQTPVVGTSESRPSPSKTSESRNGTPGQDDFGPVRFEKMTKIRKTIAAQMHKSWSTAPRVVNFDDADVTELEAFRQSSKDDYAARGVKLTTMPFLIKAIATALRHHPALNAMIDLENEQIVYKDYINIGIAVDTDRGLVVPTIRGTDKMSIPDIAQSLGNLSARVRNNDFAISDLRGGTFTISNLGAIGGTYSTPIINVPEVAILLVGKTRKLPVVMDDDSIKPRLMMPLSLAYDHRLVDGATAARFLNDVIAYLEAPSRLLLAL